MSFFHDTPGRITWEHREITLFTLGDSEEIFLAEDAEKILSTILWYLSSFVSGVRAELKRSTNRRL